MNFKNLIAKPVISLFDASVVGTVISVKFSEDLKKLKALIIENASDVGYDELVLDCKNIYKVGADAVLIRNRACLQEGDIDALNGFNPINLPVYTTSGDKLGIVQNFIITPSFHVEKICCGDDKEISVSDIAKINTNVILVNTKEHNISVNKFRPKLVNANKNGFKQVAKILPIEVNEQNVSQLQYYSEDEKEVIVKEGEESENIGKIVNDVVPTEMTRLQTLPSTLVGRVLTRNIVAINGEIIGKNGSKITENTIRLATRHQKLRELQFYAK